MIDDRSSTLEARLQLEIEKIEIRIQELNQEKHALQRQLMKARQENYAIRDVHRKNSIVRVMIENRIINSLSAAKSPMRTRELFSDALYINFSLNENTFRTYLHRLKRKGLIEAAPQMGWWRLPSSGISSKEN